MGDDRWSTIVTDVAAGIGDLVPEWVAHIIQSLEGSVPAAVWIAQYRAAECDWNQIPAISEAFRLTSTFMWMAQSDFVSRLLDERVEMEVPQQSMERFICTEVLKQLHSGNDCVLDRASAVRVTRSLATHLMSQAFQRVATDYTWDRVVFDTIPFMIGFAKKILADDTDDHVVFGDIQRNVGDVSNDSVKMFAWHLYMEMEGAECLTNARAIATDIVTKGSFPLHACCKSVYNSPADVAAVLVVEHRQNGDAARRLDTDGNSPMHYAAQRKDCDHGRLVRVLFSAGANVNVKNHAGLTPIAFGCQAGASARTVEELLLNSSDPTVPDRHGMTPLHYAVRSQRGDLVRLLESSNVNINAQDHDGFTPAHVAASSGSVSMLELLASLGACLGIECNRGWTPLKVAARRRHANAVLFLFQTRNFLAARFPFDPKYGQVFDVLRSQLSDMSSIERVSITGLGIDHLVPEIAHLHQASRIDVRHNSLRTYWWLPWWWIPVYSRPAVVRLTLILALLWAIFAACGLLIPSSYWNSAISFSSCNLRFGFAHMAAFLTVLALSFVIVIPIRTVCITPFNKAYCDYDRFRPTNANLLFLLGLMIELLQLSSLMYSVDRENAISKLFRASVLDYGMKPSATRSTTSICIGMVYLIRIWIEARSFAPKLWMYDSYLSFLLWVTYFPIARVLLLSFIMKGKNDPTDIGLFIFSIGALFAHIPTAIFGEVALQARDGKRQIQIPAVSSVCLKLFLLFLAMADVFLNQPLTDPIHRKVFACWMIPIAFACSAFLGKDIFLREPLLIRASVFWAAFFHAIAVLNFGPPWTLLSWPFSALFVFIALHIVRLRTCKRFAVALRYRRRKAQRDALWQCFRLHPKFEQIIADFDAGMVCVSLEKKYELDIWLRQNGPTNVVIQVTQAMLQIEHDIPVNLPSL